MLLTVEEVIKNLLERGVQEDILKNPEFKSVLSEIINKKGFQGFEIKDVSSDTYFIISANFSGITNTRKFYGFSKETDIDDNKDYLYVFRAWKRDDTDWAALDHTEYSLYEPLRILKKIDLGLDKKPR